MRRILDDEVLHDELSAARRPRCRRPLFSNNGGGLLGDSQVFHDTLDGIEVKFDLCEDPTKTSVDCRLRRGRIVPNELARGVCKISGLDDD